MRKWNIVLLLLLLLTPVGSAAQEEEKTQVLPALFSAVAEGLEAGLEEGVAAGALAAANGEKQELTLEIIPADTRIEAGKTLRLMIKAGNPLTQEKPVSFALQLPRRLTAAPDAAWEAVLPAAQRDESTGEIKPSVSIFTREIALMPGGKSEEAEIACEMNMGTRFYRARVPLALCVPDIAAAASLEGAEDGRLSPGDVFAYRLEITNSGAAPKDVAVSLTLPDGVELVQEAPKPLEAKGNLLSGTVRAEAAEMDGGSPSCTVLTLPLRVSGTALENDADAMRLMSGILRVDDARVALPRVQVCGARVSAKLVTQAQALETGAETTLNIVLANAGLAPASVRVACALPGGLTLAPQEDGDGAEDEEKTSGEAQMLPVMKREDGMLVYDLTLPAAQESEDGLKASTQVIPVRVKAQKTQQNAGEELHGAALAWCVDGGEAQLGEAVAMRVYRASFLGIPREEWSGVLWAAGLLLVTVCCLYAAVRQDKGKEDYCLE